MNGMILLKSILVILFLSSISKAQSNYDYLNLNSPSDIATVVHSDYHIYSIIIAIEHTGLFNQNFITNCKLRLTLYLDNEKIYSKIHVLNVNLNPSDLDNFTIPINRSFHKEINGDYRINNYIEFLPN